MVQIIKLFRLNYTDVAITYKIKTDNIDRLSKEKQKNKNYFSFH